MPAEADNSHTVRSDEPTCLATPYLNALCCKMVILHFHPNTKKAFCQYRGGKGMAYYVGFDIGTKSVGWAVTDEGYSILKKNGKALWGARQFPEAQKAVERRGFRIARRRLERREQRLTQLRDIFAKAVAAVDPAFFQRMEESRFLAEDKRPDGNGRPLGRYTLFADRDYCDRDYHREFPTIYHLRRALMFEDRPFDVRLVYLAVHHILKKRGHFLFDGVTLEDVTFESCMAALGDYLRDEHSLAFASPTLRRLPAR